MSRLWQTIMLRHFHSLFSANRGFDRVVEREPCFI